MKFIIIMDKKQGMERAVRVLITRQCYKRMEL